MSARLHLESLLKDWTVYDEAGSQNYQQVFDIVKKYPALAKVEVGEDGETLLAYFVAAKAPLEMVKEVFEMHPDAIEEDNYAGNLPLHTALEQRCGFEVIEFLILEFPGAAAQENAEDGYLPLRTLLFGNDEGNFIEGHFTEGQFRRLFQLLYEAHPPSYWSFPDSSYSWDQCRSSLMALSPNVAYPLLAWIAERPSYESDEDEPDEEESTFRLRFTRRPTPPTPTLIRNLKHLVPNLKCKWMALECYQLNLALDQFFSEVKIPPTLGIKLENVQLSLPANLDLLKKTWSSCQLKRLVLADLDISTQDFQRLLQSLQSLPNLEFLQLSKEDAPTRVSWTGPVIQLLESSKNLKSLEIHGLEVDIEELCQALQNSTTSRAMVWYRESSHKDFAKVAYHSALNFHGRTRIAATNATKAVLLDCVNNLHSNDELESVRKLKESVLYGLLREAPGLWADNEARSVSHPAKRPASESLGSQKRKKSKSK